MREFTASELDSYLRSAADKPFLLDVREPWEYDRARIEGAQLIPMRSVPAQLDALNPEQETVVICHHGVRSRMVCMFLEKQGFSNVINLSGGVEAWARDVDPHMPTY